MEITTARLLLREFTKDDAPAFLAYHDDPRYSEFYGPGEAGRVRALELLDLFNAWELERPRRKYQLAIAMLRSPPQLVGCCGLRRETADAVTAQFGIEFAPECWGNGYATEAARALLEFGFRELGLVEVRSVTVSVNAPVAALAQRIGLVKVGTLAGPDWMRARGWNQTEWLLTRERWETTVLPARKRPAES